jgi:hypothetical protein
MPGPLSRISMKGPADSGVMPPTRRITEFVAIACLEVPQRVVAQHLDHLSQLPRVDRRPCVASGSICNRTCAGCEMMIAADVVDLVLQPGSEHQRLGAAAVADATACRMLSTTAFTRRRVLAG